MRPSVGKRKVSLGRPQGPARGPYANVRRSPRMRVYRTFSPEFGNRIIDEPSPHMRGNFVYRKRGYPSAMSKSADDLEVDLTGSRHAHCSGCCLPGLRITPGGDPNSGGWRSGDHFSGRTLLWNVPEILPGITLTSGIQCPTRVRIGEEYGVTTHDECGQTLHDFLLSLSGPGPVDQRRPDTRSLQFAQSIRAASRKASGKIEGREKKFAGVSVGCAMLGATARIHRRQP